MAKDAQKVAKRSAKKLARAADRSAKRLDKLLAGTVRGDDLGKTMAEQWVDMVDTWLSFFTRGDAVPRAFIDIPLPPSPTTPPTSIAGEDIVSLDDPAPFGILSATPLTSPGLTPPVTVILRAIDDTTPPATQEMEDIKVKVSVADTQPKGLYHGFVSAAGAVVVEVYVNVR
jgi:hypothetical protein